jgi:ATP-dependent Zn protease
MNKSQYSSNISLKFIQINSSSNSNNRSYYYERSKNIKLNTGSTNNNELVINTAELDDNSKYACCIIDNHPHLSLLNSSCVYLIKNFTTNQTNLSSYTQTKQITSSSTHSNYNNKIGIQKEKESPSSSSFYGVEYPVLIIILIVFLLIIAACFKLSRDKNNKIQQSTNYMSDQNRDQTFQEDISPFPFTFSLVPQHQSDSLNVNDQSTGTIYCIKPFELIDLPPSYEDAVKTKTITN